MSTAKLAPNPDDDCCPKTGEDATGATFRHACLRHLQALYAMALRLTRNPSDAEDLVQETYLKAVRSADSYDPSRECKAWLFKIMTNIFVDQYRRSSKEPQLSPLEEGDERAFADEPRLLGLGMPGSGAEPGSAEDTKVLLQLLDEDVNLALEMLPERFRMPILLCDMEGFSYAEIADMLNIPVGTVMSRLYRGRRLLKTSLLDYATKRGYVTAGAKEARTSAAIGRKGDGT